MLPSWWRVLQILSDAKFHSGAGIACSLRITRAAVWKHVNTLRAYGIDVHAVTGKGYRLPYRIDLLDSEGLARELAPLLSRHAGNLEVLIETPSTNQVLLDRAGKCVHGAVCVAEFQSAGRGRRGRTWVSPLAGGLCLSVGWRFELPMAQINALGMATAVAMIKALEGFGIGGLGVKWPNDLFSGGRKLGGVLIEVKGVVDGPCQVVVGIGLNINPSSAMDSVDQPWTALLLEQGRSISRNQLCVALVRTLFDSFAKYQREGFSTFREDWCRYDIIKDRAVKLSSGNRELTGHACGIDDDGALLMSINGGMQRFLCGEISLRFTDACG